MIDKIKVRLDSVELSDEQRSVIEQILDEVLAETVDELNDMIERWESLTLEDDTTLYSLGIRRSVDVVTGEASISQLPILETENTPDE